MVGLRSFLLLSFAYCVLAEEVHIFTPCHKEDIKCLTKATESFMENTRFGFPKYDVKPTDPLVIPELDIAADEDIGLIFKFTNMTVTGLKNLKFYKFTMDTDKKSVMLKTKVSLNIVSDFNIKFTKHDKKFSGLYTATATALGSFQYGYSFTKIDDREHFVVGPETITCEILGDPEVTIGGNLQNSLENDSLAPDLTQGYESNKVNLRKKTICKVVEIAYATVVHNIRALAKIIPKEEFILDH